jgi:hypothetical protein
VVCPDLKSRATRLRSNGCFLLPPRTTVGLVPFGGRGERPLRAPERSPGFQSGVSVAPAPFQSPFRGIGTGFPEF